MGERVFESYGDKVTVSFDDSEEAKSALLDYLLDCYFFEYEVFSGEVIMQSDDPQIYAPVVMSNIAEKVLKFDVDWGD